MSITLRSAENWFDKVAFARIILCSSHYAFVPAFFRLKIIIIIIIRRGLVHVIMTLTGVII